MSGVAAGLVYDMSDEEYHSSHDWLSASGIKKLVPPSTPAHFKQWIDGQGTEEPKAHFDLGKITHALVLGRGAEFEVVQKVGRDKVRKDADDLKTVSAQEHAAAIRAEGKVPILRDDLAEAQAMADAVLTDPIASALLSTGTPETSAFWIDEATGVQCRARFDFLPEPRPGERLIVPDLKTAHNASRQKFTRSAGDWAYHVQDAHYSDAIQALGIDDDPAFLFVVIEKGSHLVNILPFDDADRKLGRALCDRSRRVYRECMETGDWYGYRRGDVIDEPMRLPPYITNTQEDWITHEHA